MSESEFLEAINLHAGNAIVSFSVFATYVFGFITATYIVGARLSKIQVAIISILYIFTSLVWIVSGITHADSFTALVAVHPDYVPSPFWLLPWPILAGSVEISTLVGSLYFLYDVRSKGALPAHLTKSSSGTRQKRRAP